jgi:heterodisulfide reductase subunit B
MDFAIFRCCPTSIFLKQYESSTDAVLKKLGIEFAEIKDFNCCGYPLKNIDFKTYVLSSARNLSLAEKKNLNIVTVCSCCYGSIKQAQQLLNEDDSLKEEINATLVKEGLKYRGDIEVKHFFEVLYKDIGPEHIRANIVKTFKDLKIAAHYGCHLLRPREITQIDNSGVDSIFDQLVEITGAESIDWPTKGDCCGSPMWGIYDDLSMDLTEKKIIQAGQSGADYLCVACVYCQLQFDRVQKVLISRRAAKTQLPSILYPQLLGLGLGIESEVLGINQNKMDLNGILGFLS